MDEDIPWQLVAWNEKWTRNPWAAWVARGDMRRERPDMTRALSRSGLAAVRVGKDRDETLLYVASYCGHAGMVMLLLGKGVKKDKANNYGWTPLYIACSMGHLEVVRLLVDAGADKDKAENTDGMTPVHAASHGGHLEIVRLLIEAGADKDKAGVKGSTPLHVACQKVHLEVVRLLVLAEEADKNQAQYDGETPLYTAKRRRR